MPKTLEEVAKDALDLPSRQKLVLANLLLETADASDNDEIDEKWEQEIQARARAVKAGEVTGIPYEEVLRKANRLLTR